MSIFLLVVALLMGVAYAIFRYSRVQTWVVHRVSEYLSSRLHTRVSVKAVNFKLPKKIILRGVYIEDLHQDTLLYAEDIKVDLKKFNLGKNSFHFNKITLSKIYFNLKQYKGDSALNLDFIMNAFSSTDTSKSKPFQIFTDHLLLRNTRFNFINENDSSKNYGMKYNELKVSAINTDIDDIKFINDTIFCRIKNLTLREQCGFELKHFSTNAKLSSKILNCKDLYITTPQSNIVVDNLKFTYARYLDYRDFNNKVHMEGFIKPSEVNMGDIAYYAPSLEGIKNIVNVSGHVSGTVNRLKAKGMDISLGTHTKLKGNINLAGLPNLEETYIDLNLESFQSTKKDIETIPIYPFTSNEHLKLPDNIANLGVFKFKGMFNGFAHDFVAYGHLQTEIGNVNADINFKVDKNNEANYSGHLSSDGFNAGLFWGNGAYFDKISLSVDLKGHGLTKQKINATVNGNIFSAGIYNYTYKNIELKSNVAKGLFKGILKVKDENIDLSFNGDVDFTKQTPVIDFIATINKAKLSKLHLINRDSSAVLSSLVSARFKGGNLDEIQGTFTANELHYSESKKKLYLKTIELTSSFNGGVRELKLNSEYIDASLKGEFLFDKLPDAFKKIADNYIYNLKLYAEKGSLATQKIDLKIDLKNIAPITNIFVPEYDIAKNTLIKGSFNSASNDFHLTVNSDFIKYGINYFRYAKLQVNSVNDHLDLFLVAKSVQTNDSTLIDSVYVSAHTTKEDIPFVISANKLSNHDNHFVINGAVSLGNNQQLNILLKDADILVQQNPWHLKSPALFSIDSMKTGRVDGLILQSNNQKIDIKGEYAFLPDNKQRSENTSLNILLENIDVSKINSITKPKGYVLGGIVNGTAKINSNKQTAKNAIESNINVTQLVINGDSLGVLNVLSSWNEDSHSISVESNLVRGAEKILSINGTYPLNNTDKINFTILADKVYLQLLSRYMCEYITNPKGLFSCDIKIGGTVKEPTIEGKVKLKKASFLVNYLNTQYSLSDEFTINTNSIDFNNVTVNDIKGNSALLKGKIHHENFKNVWFDLSLKTNNFQMLNTTAKQNDSYYGTAYGTGKITLNGSSDNLVLDIGIKTERETQFFIPLESTGNAEERDFITFINTGNTKKEDRKNYISKVKKNLNLSGFTLNMDLDVTTDAETQLIFDSKIGDIIKARGSGNIKLAISTLGDFNMYGDYTIDKGDYLFTLKNLTNKHFLIDRGGTIRWNGNPGDAEINLVATYKLKAALRDLIQSQSTGADDPYAKRIPVECKLYMTGKLLNPNIKFDINFPSLEHDETTYALVRNVINPSKQDEVNNQMFSLLLLGSFSPPAGSSNASNSNSVYSVGGSNFSEIASNQLTNIVSQLGKSFSQKVDFNVNYRSRDEVSRNEQMDVGVTTQLFNDRVILNGSVGRTNNQNTATLVGDFIFEYKVREDGRFRVKAFNKSVNSSLTPYNAIIYNSPYTQGVGLSYREEFSTFKELIQRYFHRKQLEDSKLK